MLSKEEVFSLSKICLSKFVDKGEMLEMMSKYFTRLIFETCDVKAFSEGIDLNLIK